MALPFLPGNSFNPNLGKSKFHKSQLFDYRNDISTMVGEHKSGIGGAPLPGQKLKPRHSAFPSGEGSDKPAWLAFDRQVLSFESYFQEAVNEKREEQFRVRKCKVYFYLEDDSIQVNEPQVKNSGIPQGTLIRRHRIPLPPPNEDEYYTVEHFNVGKEIELYGRTFKLTNCNQFTANFLRKLGVQVNLPENTPSDPYSNYRQQLDDSMQPLRPYERYDTLKQFLDNDGKVLRFYCYWDDSDAMFGDSREMVMHYFLADDTIEIREKITPNSGRDAAPKFLNRARLPKNAPTPLNQPGEKTDRTVLNVFGPTGHGGRYILDSLKTGAVHLDFYHDGDLTIGSVVNVWGRKIVICDCDEFTREYYRSKYGISEFGPLQYKAPAPGRPGRVVPPYNGFGSEEDSLCSCAGLIPKPPRRDFIKFMEKDRHGLESNVLRFMARMDTTKPIDADRRFIISYFLSDDTLLVFEPPVRNSGVIGGKFLERGRVKKPGQELYKSDPSAYYLAQDLFVGAKVQFNNHIFVLIDADEYAFMYMEKHSPEFPVAHVHNILGKLKAQALKNTDDIKQFFLRNDPNGVGQIPYEVFRNLLTQVCGNKLVEHEIMTLGRYFSERQDEKVNISVLLGVAQEQLRKHNFENFTRLKQLMMHHDTSRTGNITRKKVRMVSKAFHVPVSDDLLRAILEKLAGTDDTPVNYQEFVDLLNWRENPVEPLHYTAAPATLSNWVGAESRDNVMMVQYTPLMGEIFGANMGDS
ncbi:EF-hand domain-containing family member C2-like [Branchiostoma lanceolatum]|uniref:EF-hand domain-containing family member C2-like n=1 Tax=Branchiostoma lanceolatum TaxID=7740 RepID=UPI0034522AB5